jgi:chemotaxis protein methyltransferase CheR
MALPLSPPVFSIISQLIEESTGLHYDPKEAPILAEKLSLRAAELGLDSLLDYYYYLRYDEAGPRELDVLVDSLVVNETYFFRERDQLAAFVDLLVPRILERQAGVRIWCAACSTGEEPLTLAMMLQERGLLERSEIVASDISSRVLSKARTGTYGGRSLRALGERERDRHFVDLGEGLVRVHDAISSSIRWRRVNLFDIPRVQALGTFDAIICRNALIYFRDAVILRLIEELTVVLNPDGLLLVGASESLLRFGTIFGCEEHGGAFFYRRTSR